MCIAIETYRPFVHYRDRQAYLKAWEEFSAIVGITQFGEYSMRENGEDKNAPFERFFKRVDAILKHAPASH